jgi:hypothetical protein
MEPSDYDNIPLYKNLYFVRGTVLLRDYVDAEVHR